MGVCVFTRWRMELTVNRKCMFYFAILHNMSINSLHLCLRLLCRLLLHCKPLSMQQDRKSSLEKFAAASWECACLQDGGRS